MSTAWESLIPGGLTGVPGAERRYEETFTATDEYTVNHGLGNEPLVQVLDSDGVMFFVQVDHETVDSLVLRFGGTLTDVTVICIV